MKSLSLPAVSNALNYSKVKQEAADLVRCRSASDSSNSSEQECIDSRPETSAWGGQGRSISDCETTVLIVMEY